jgi:hypothetical protein
VRQSLSQQTPVFVAKVVIDDYQTFVPRNIRMGQAEPVMSEHVKIILDNIKIGSEVLEKSILPLFEHLQANL